MKNSLMMLIVLALASTSLLAIAQEPTNAFLDLERQGTVNEKHSIMRVSATADELDALLSECPASGYFCFVETHDNDIRLFDSIPQIWCRRTTQERISLNQNCRPGQFFTYQIGIYSPYNELQDVKVKFSDLTADSGDKIPASAIRCLNSGGKDIYGKSFTKEINVARGRVQPLWVGLQTNTNNGGTYKGTATITPTKGGKAVTVNISLSIEGEKLSDSGDGYGANKSRLRWLDFDGGNLNNVTKGYKPIEIKGNEISYLSGRVKLDESGMPASITTFYDQSNNLCSDYRNEVLAKAMQLVVETAQGAEVLKFPGVKILKKDETQVSWRSQARGKNVMVELDGSFDFDGFFNYSIAVTALRDVEVKDIRLEVPYTKYASKYMMGAGRSGGLRGDSTYKWSWDTTKHQDRLWMGNVNAGLNLHFKDENYKRPLVNVYYGLGRLREPKSWANSGKGGITISDNNDIVMVTAFSGERTMQRGQKLYYNMEMLVTPVRPIDLKAQSDERIYHSNSDLSQNYISEAKNAGANYITIHHKKDNYPYINYPYHDHSVASLKDFIAQAHKEQIKVRAYYTTRELTVNIPELWALRSLGSEVIYDGPGPATRTLIHGNGPNPWLNENLKDNFIPAWFNAFNEGPYKGEMDISVITTPDSRWNNYYLAGLDWMVRNIGLDGVYIDDSALDRKTLQRARRILDNDGQRRLIDIHSWNHSNPYAGEVSSLNIYMDLLPYVDRLWIGESFGAENRPDFWLVEMSGIPFGLMSETLDAHNQFRGMVFGMLPRLPWSGNPKPLWKLWDDFGMSQATMRGFWDSQNPIQIDNDNLRVTTFMGKDQALVCIANWSDQPQSGAIKVNQALLGFKATTVSQPEIYKMQWGEDKVDLARSQRIEANSGVILLLKK